MGQQVCFKFLFTRVAEEQCRYDLCCQSLEVTVCRLIGLKKVKKVIRGLRHLSYKDKLRETYQLRC